MAHAAVIMVVAAICGSQGFKKQAEASLTPGQSFLIGPYALTFERVVAQEKANKTSISARMRVTENDRELDVMEPALSFYNTQKEPVGTPDVRTLGATDLYLSLLSFEQDGSRVAVKAFINPLVSLIWLSLPVFGLGALLSFWPTRRPAAKILEKASAS